MASIERQDKPKHATEAIRQQQNEVRNSLPFDDTQDFTDASQGFLRKLEHNVVFNSNHEQVWNNDSYSFLSEDAPATANPSLWRQSQLCVKDGLFEVVPGIYQVRGLDLSNITFIEGDEGLIVIDPLTCNETAKVAFDLYRRERDVKREKKVKAVIYTHSHTDHYGGVKGIISEGDVANGVEVIAPEGFLEHAVSENVYAGVAMARRAGYMYGAALDRGPRGGIGAGLGQTTSTGTVSLIAPTITIIKTGETRKIDGIEMVFQMAPDTEAPSEMLFYFPKFRALLAAEDATHTFHNVLTLRGAVVRDPHIWAKTLTETIHLFGRITDVVFASHHWPTWGNDRVVEFLTNQRDLYAYIHDQCLRCLNQGLTGPEIAEQMQLPPVLEKAWNSRGYYGSVSHNCKAVYQRYMGWFDGNPAHLWEHTPVNRANRYVELIGESQIISAAQSAFDQGDFRWAAELLNHVSFAGVNNDTAKYLLADTYEQLGYGAENGPWRDFYLSGALELRTENFGTPTQTASADVISQLTPEMIFDSIAIQIDGPRSWDEKISIYVDLTDLHHGYRLWMSNGALIYFKQARYEEEDVTITATTKSLPQLAVIGLHPLRLAENGVMITGNLNALENFAGLLSPGDPSFNIVTP